MPLVHLGDGGVERVSVAVILGLRRGDLAAQLDPLRTLHFPVSRAVARGQPLGLLLLVDLMANNVAHQLQVCQHRSRAHIRFHRVAVFAGQRLDSRQATGLQTGGHRVRQLVGKSQAVAPRRLVAEIDRDRELPFRVVIGGVFRYLVAQPFQVGLVALTFLHQQPSQPQSRAPRLVQQPLSLLLVVVADRVAHQVQLDTRAFLGFQVRRLGQIVEGLARCILIGAPPDRQMDLVERIRPRDQVLHVVFTQRIHLLRHECPLRLGQV